jgi:hypothetical protein
MNGATQVINLAAGYLAPELRGRRVRSFTDLVALLDGLFSLLRQASGSAVFAILSDVDARLDDLRNRLGAKAWKTAVARIREHPFMCLIEQDPLTARSLLRPRGHTPDAITLDLLYRESSAWPLPPDTTRLGMQIYGYASLCATAGALRTRRDLIAQAIDRVAEQVDAPAILALECGHLREARMSRAFREGRLARLVALDREAEAIATVTAEVADPALTARQVPSYAILHDGVGQLGRFDFIYTASLAERLSEAETRRTLAAAFAMLNPGGKLFIGNLAPQAQAAAWFETFMDWWPQYRDQAHLESLISGLPREAIAGWHVFADPTKNVNLLEITRV